jgi:FkbM family methyltransferase
MQGLIIDVGANEGIFALQQAITNPNHLVIAIEPIPELAKSITQKAIELKLGNLIVKEVAIDIANGWRSLQISDAFSKGTSSLLDFAQPRDLDEYWEARPDSRRNRSVDVRCVRLEEMIDEILKQNQSKFDQEIKIDFLKIDVQGKDYEVLLSIGKYIKNVKAGMLEAPVLPNNSIYVDQKKSIVDYFIALKELGFIVFQLKPNDPDFYEYNIYFCQIGLEISSHVEGLNLFSNEIYFGNVNPNEDTLRVINSFRNSLSWKITYPLRCLKRKIIS